MVFMEPSVFYPFSHIGYSSWGIHLYVLLSLFYPFPSVYGAKAAQRGGWM